MATFIIGLVILIGGAALYGRFCEKVFGPDDRKTPAYTKEDGVDFVPTWNNLPWVKGISWSDAMESVKTYLPDIKSAVSTADTRLGKNREKMEADLKATGKKAAPAPKKAAPKAAPAEDPKAKARAALAKAAAAKKAKAAKK